LAEGFRAGFAEGATVEIGGLKGMPELNGRRGKLVTFNSQSLRWNVDIEGGAGTKALNPANLVPVAADAGQRTRKGESCDDDGGEPAEKRQKVE